MLNCMINFNTNYTTFLKAMSPSELDNFIETMSGNWEEKAAELEITVDELLNQVGSRVTLTKLSHQRMHGH